MIGVIILENENITTDELWQMLLNFEKKLLENDKKFDEIFKELERKRPVQNRKI